MKVPGANAPPKDSLKGIQKDNYDNDILHFWCFYKCMHIVHECIHAIKDVGLVGLQ